MKIYDGTVELIGAGTWVDGGGGGQTKLSVLEIGNKTFKNIMLPDYLSNYLIPGKNVRVLIYKGIRSHLVTAVEVGNKKYKIGTGRFLILALVKIIVLCLCIFFLGLINVLFLLVFSIPLFIFIGSQIKNYLDLVRF